MDEKLSIVFDEIKDVLSNINSRQIDKVVDILNQDKIIFLDGEGRSGYVSKMFAMRLMHIGETAHAIGESTTPKFKAGNIYICISGSGNTEKVYINAKNAKEAGCEVISLTNNPESKIGRISDQIIEFDAVVRGDSRGKSIQLLGSLFDQSVHILLDYICLQLSHKKNITKEQANSNHF